MPNVRGCIKIDLVTDTAAILNLLDLSSGGGGVSKEICGTVRLPVYDVTSRVGSFQNGEQILFIEETDKNFYFITEILFRFLGFGDLKVSIVIEN